MKQADFMVLANGVDITAKIRDRLVSLAVHDAAGIESDTVTIELDNRDNAIALPPRGAQLNVWMGYVGELVFKGVFEVDELEEPLDDEALVIHGKAAKMSGAFKAPRDRTYDDITFGQLVEQIATAHGYEPAVSEALATIVFEHIDQRGESDMNLLTRLARDHGAVAKPVADKLVVVAKAASESVSGADLPVIVIADPANSGGRVTLTGKSEYSAVKASWFEEEKQQRRQVTAGEGEPLYTLRQTFKDAEAAQAAADAKLAELQRGTASLSLTRPLAAHIMPEGILQLVNHKASANREWLVETVEHVIGGNEVAYTTVSAVTPGPEAADNSAN